MSSEAERSWQGRNPAAFAAWEMAQVFDNNRNEEGRVSDIGLTHLKQLFGNVPEEYRGDVFVLFLAELDERDIDYDMKQFMEQETVH